MELTKEQKEQATKYNKEFSNLCNLYKLDPDTVYEFKNKEYPERVKLSNKFGVIKESDATLLGLLKLQSMFDDIFNTDINRVTKAEFQQIWNILTNKDNPTLITFCELAGIAPSCIVEEAKKRYAMQNTKIRVKEKETHEQVKEYLHTSRSYAILCNEIKKEYLDLEDNPTPFFERKELDILLDKKKEYDEYWIESDHPHMIDVIPVKRYGIKTNIIKLINAKK